MKYKKIKCGLVLLMCATMLTTKVNAQTDMDAIMMEKKQFCVGPMAGYSSWKDYWEGTFKRDNANLGRVSTEMYSVMGNYGISNKLNVLFNLPYVKTRASAGQLHGMKGIQDLSLWIKYMPVEMSLGRGLFSVYTIGGLSLPASNYVADFLPLSIGAHSKNISLRLMTDYQLGQWFATGSATYVNRSNITIDRTAYYTTEMHYSNKVKLPDVMQYNFRTGIRNERLIAEAVLSQWSTLGGFDITKNNMPFPSNNMDMTTVGINFKYNLKNPAGMSLTGGAHQTVAGRNVGEALAVNLGIFYILDFNKKAITTTPDHQTIN